ncbi:MAG: 30S ribosomal protein S4 [Candidatus Marinimicrobia bacterium]|nr:30S ribosomal protein S4 [Candidatus Neomarinimicrobiota bacterium]
MAKYTGPKCRLCRREGMKLFLKGDRCLSERCSFEKRSYPPGQHGQTLTRRPSNYALQLREKQKIKRIYGVLERQFKKYFEMASRRKGKTGDNLMKILESRLDNVVYRLGFAASRSQARQLVNHGHFLVNGRPVNIPSYLLKPGDIVQVREKSKKLQIIHDAMRRIKGEHELPWLILEKAKMRGIFIQPPGRDQLDLDVKESLVVELYSK